MRSRSELLEERIKVALKPIRKIIGVFSGKGGVGKTAISINIAAALSLEGCRVGILDADVDCPNVFLALGIEQPLRIEGNTLIPAEKDGIKVISMAGIQDQKTTAILWRGPLVTSALYKMIGSTAWGELDYLFVDLPPGTGDVHLTLVQTVPITGAVIVSTPQDVGLMISMKTLRMLEQTNVKILGIIENMSYHLCSHCGQREEIFGHGGARNTSEKLSIPFLGEIPLDAAIRVNADKGSPVVVASPDSGTAKTYREIARNLAAQISVANYSAPKLEVVEEAAS